MAIGGNMAESDVTKWEWEKEDSPEELEQIRIVGLITGEKIICKYSEKVKCRETVAICKQIMTWYVNAGPDGRQALTLGDWIPTPIYDKTNPIEIEKKNILFTTEVEENMARNYQQMVSSILIPESNATERWDDISGLKEGKIIE